MKYRHYAPQAPLILAKNKKEIQNLIDYYQKKKKILGVMATKENKKIF